MKWFRFGKILIRLKPYLDIESDVIMEELIYHLDRQSKETFNSYINRKFQKYRELQAALGNVTIKCEKCSATSTQVKEFPDEFWTFLIKRGSKLNEE